MTFFLSADRVLEKLTTAIKEGVDVFDDCGNEIQISSLCENSIWMSMDSYISEEFPLGLVRLKFPILREDSIEAGTISIKYKEDESASNRNLFLCLKKAIQAGEKKGLIGKNIVFGGKSYYGNIIFSSEIECLSTCNPAFMMFPEGGGGNVRFFVPSHF